MECIYCSGKTQVVNSRPQKKQAHVWRRRRCLSCEAIFTTGESPDLLKSLVVDDGTRFAPFDRDKLLISLYLVCGHRTDPVESAAGLTDTTVSKLLVKAESGKLTRNQIIKTASTVLKRFDSAAAVQYAAYHH